MDRGRRYDTFVLACKTQPPRFAEKVVYQLAGWAGKWNAVPLTLNNQGTGSL